MRLSAARLYESGGWGFKSLRARHKPSISINISPSSQQTVLPKYDSDKFSCSYDSGAMAKVV